MDPRNVSRILGKLASERGRSSEKRLLTACLLPGRPEWMRAARRATKQEDHDGIDVVVESDVGKLFIQVKSSRRGKVAFEQRARRARIAVVVVARDDGPEKLLRKVVGQLAAIRAEYLRERSGR
jgi:hypothetical protein